MKATTDLFYGSTFPLFWHKMKTTEQIRDAFHIWSRNAFDGENKKTDIDIIAYWDKDATIIGLVEVKRSAKVRVGKWRPYIEDLNNYLLCMSFSNIINADFYTVHHTIVNQQPMTNKSLLDVFRYASGSVKFPSAASFDAFRNRNQILKAENVVQLIANKSRK
jgi:hypothetical protein